VGGPWLVDAPRTPVGFQVLIHLGGDLAQGDLAQGVQVPLAEPVLVACSILPGG
jgi:hypothetical protein